MTEIEPADGLPPLGRLVAALSDDGSDGGGLDVAALERILTSTLADALPSGMVEVQRQRSFGDRVAGRTGVVVGLTVRAGDQSLVLHQGRGGVTEAFIGRQVRGVTISRSPVGLVEWLTALARQLTARAAADQAARQALRRLLLD